MTAMQEFVVPKSIPMTLLMPVQLAIGIPITPRPQTMPLFMGVKGETAAIHKHAKPSTFSNRESQNVTLSVTLEHAWDNTAVPVSGLATRIRILPLCIEKCEQGKKRRR